MRLFFDECCCKRLARELEEFFSVDYPNLETAHLLDKYRSGESDSVWLKNLKHSGDWIVITQDSARKSNKDKLPEICKELEITHVSFSPAIINGGYSVQKAALATVWPHLMRLNVLPKGTHVRLTKIDVRGRVSKFVLMVKGKPLSFES